MSFDSDVTLLLSRFEWQDDDDEDCDDDRHNFFDGPKMNDEYKGRTMAGRAGFGRTFPSSLPPIVMS
jgi:hypothetical protein